MAGKKQASKSGRELQARVVGLSEDLGLQAQVEVRAARRLWGAVRRIDVVLTESESRKKLGVECKFQGSSGSAEEKIPATLNDLEHWPIPGIIVIDGPGFSEKMSSYLMASGRVVWFEDLEDWLSLFFSL
tara:strand:- start:131 stop:520 length:390 start_codon:yes stop_codon:yes gene_type:complete